MVSWIDLFVLVTCCFLLSSYRSYCGPLVSVHLPAPTSLVLPSSFLFPSRHRLYAGFLFPSLHPSFFRLLFPSHSPVLFLFQSPPVSLSLSVPRIPFGFPRRVGFTCRHLRLSETVTLGFPVRVGTVGCSDSSFCLFLRHTL